jgi:hypothetical protein
MPRIRTIKPEFWQDEQMSTLPLPARLLFIGTWNLADDYGILKGGNKWIKAQLFPYDDNIRLEQIDQWTDLLVKARMLIPFTFETESYLYIRTFKNHQKIDKPSKNGNFSADKLSKLLKLNEVPKTFDEYSTSVRRLFADQSCLERKGKEGKGREGNTPADAEERADESLILKGLYENLDKTKSKIYEFIKAKKPDFIQPYVDLWNVFAKERSIPEVSKITKSRERQFGVRLKEPGFDFLRILSKAASSEFLLKGSWFGFDWILANDKNYLKVLEGNYDKKKEQPETNPASQLSNVYNSIR